ncbi:MAG: nuclear transport factor 2 family protein [Flavobacteriia bacterium]|nr:nuclear transport factor 2 family protein [Flavobacteriia bacterium]
MQNYIAESDRILDLIESYFLGIYDGKTDLLRSVFHPKAMLFGDINGKEYLKTLDEYLEGVEARQSPSELGESYEMKVLSIEINGQVALAKVNVPILSFNYQDFLSLAVVNDEWVIVNKTFTHVE